VADFERRLILKALKKTAGNQKRAAQLLQLNATTLNEKIKRLEIDPNQTA
jgi:DNA-binding NtrC family response regulator